MDKGGSAVVLSASQTVASKIPASLNGLNESQLRALLETTFNFEERLAIRRAIRQQRKKSVESQEASRTTTENTASHLQKDSSQARTRLSKSNGKVQHKSDGKSSARTLSTSNGHNLEVKTAFRSDETDKSDKRNVQTTHGSGKASLDSYSSAGKTEQRICEHVGLESGKLDQNRVFKKEENELDLKMDDVESKNLKNISLKDTVSAGKELKEYVREIESEHEHGKRENGKEMPDLVKHDKEQKKEDVSFPNDMENDSGCEEKKERSDEETLQKDDNEKGREIGKSGVDLEADVELSHRLIEVHIDDKDDAEKELEEEDSQDALSSQMKESHQMSNPVGRLIEKEETEVEETANKEENEAGDVLLSQDDCCLESEKIGLSVPEITEKIPSHRTEDSHVESETEGSLKASERIVEVVGHQLVGSRQDDDGDAVSKKDCNSNETGPKEKEEKVKEKAKECETELVEFQKDNTPSSNSHKKKDLSILSLELGLEEKGETSELQKTKEVTDEGYLGTLERIDDNVVTELSDETISHGSEKETQQVCDSTKKIRSIDSGSKGKARTLSGEQGESYRTVGSEGVNRFTDDEIKGKIEATSSGKEKGLQGISKSDKSESVETESEGKDRTTSSGREEQPVGTCEGSAKTSFIDSESKDKDRDPSSEGEKEPQGISEKSEISMSIETESEGKNKTSLSGRDEQLLGTSESSAKTRFISSETKGKDRITSSGRQGVPQGSPEKSEISRSIETESEVKEKTALSEKEPQKTTTSREKITFVETETDGKETTSSERQKAFEEEEKQELKLEDINDESVLRKMLDNNFDFEERRKIRAAIRALKKKQQSQSTPEKKIVQQSYLNLQNSSWKSGRNTAVSKTNASPKVVTNSGRKLNLGKQSSLEKELPKCYAKSNLASRKEAELIIDDQTNASHKRDTLSATKDEEVSEERLSSREILIPSVLEKPQPFNSSSSSSSCTNLKEQSNRKVPNETVKVECTHEDERNRARQRRREWQKSLLRSYEDPEISPLEGDVKQGEERREKGITNGNKNKEVDRMRSKTDLKTEEAFSKRQFVKLQSQEDDDNASVKSESSFYSKGTKSSSIESSDQSVEISNESPSGQMSETDVSEGAIEVTTQIDTVICGDTVLQEGSQAGEEKSAIRSKDRTFKSDTGSSKSTDGVRKLAETKQSSFSSRSSSSSEVENENGETPEHSKKSVIVHDVVRVEIKKREDLKGQEDVVSDEKSKESMKESEGIKEEKPLSLKGENQDKVKEERSTFISSRWREPKKANFKDLRKQFLSGFEKQKEEKKEDRVLKGVKGRVSQAALLFNSPSSCSSSPQPLSSEACTPKRGSSSTYLRTSDRGITDQKLEGNSTRRFSSEFSLSDKRKNKAETKSSLQVDSNKDEETSLNKGVEESPSTSIYMTPVGTPGSPDIFYTPKEAMDGTPANLGDSASVSKPSEVGEQSLLHSKRMTVVEGDQHRKKVKVEAGKLSSEETPQTQETDTTMAPTVEQITDETTLEKMLEEATIFEDRKKIRARLRELRKQKRGDADASTVTTERKRTRASALTVNTTQQSSENKEVKPVGTTALSPVSPAAKTVRTDSNLANDHSTKVVETDDGKTKTMTMTSVKTAPGAKSTQVTTMSKTDDGAGTKAASVKQETTTTKVETSSDGTKTSFSKTTTSTFSSSSSSSTDKPATGKPQSKFQMELEEKRKKRAEQQKADEAKWKADQEARRKAAYEKKKKEEAEAAKKKANLMDKFGGKATTVGPAGPKKTVAGGSTRMMAQNPATIKAKLLEWAKRCTRGYANVKIENFSGSWCDGMAFCAVIHSYFPDAFDFNSLDPNNRRHNFDLAFNTAEKYADIYPLLETDDMIMMKNKPDWKCVFTYVQALYRGLHKATGQVPA
ncbi:Smoothelin [Holothuria leucospilota]|uniref:Smoothelin n=1 Tax=Holothuria leucospilota TaxID=206669 RepID=A0A9Q1CD26_HOLLE|nr:Smoothelin [Holothuria leucospilota]